MAEQNPRSSRSRRIWREALRSRIANAALRLIVMLFVAQGIDCHQAARKEAPIQSMPRKDINRVLHDHDRELMQIHGVVGVYVGLADDGATQCLKVMVERRTPEIEKRVPKTLEGYAVVLDESGTIRPMRKK